MIGDWRPDRRIVDPDLLRILKLRWDCCCLCGVVENLHIHHIVYRSQSGDDVEGNLCCLCGGNSEREGCHTAIHSRDPEKWAELAMYIEEERPDIVAYLRVKLGGRAFLYRDLPFHTDSG